MTQGAKCVRTRAATPVQRDACDWIGATLLCCSTEISFSQNTTVYSI